MSAPTPVPNNILSDRLRDFSARFHGDLLRPGNDGYEAARIVWNGMVDRRPAAIARCRTVDDVQSAIRFARENDLPIAIRGGGHNAAGLAVCDGGLVIDLRGMRDVVVDPVARTAHAGGGATWGEFDAATTAHGLATTGGAVSTTGIAGLTLGGGLGWLMRSYGMTCDNLIGAEVVTADGQVGVVTTFEFQLHRVAKVLGGILFYPLARARDVLRFYRDFVRTAPDALTVFAAMMHTPDGQPVCGLAICYNGPAEEGERAIKAIRDFEPAIAGEVGPIPYTALQSMLDGGFPSGLQVHWRSEFLASIPDTLIDALVSAYERVPSPLSALIIEQFGGAVHRVPAASTAFDNRDSDFNLVIVSRWTDPAAAERNVVWARATSDAAKPFTNGRVYVNYIGVGEAPDRVRAAFSPEKFARLAQVKKQYDPRNVFRINQNIPPG
jgi:FAD/FMN-containing dehydrogenase